MRILTVATYPVDNPRHGGQKRVAAIIEQYRNAGHIVKHVAIMLEGSYPGAGKDDVVVSDKKYTRHPRASIIGDILLADILQGDSKSGDKFTDVIKAFEPDVVEVEQSFLYRTVSKQLDSIGVKPTRINSTQNVEFSLKPKILRAMKIKDESVELVAKEIRDVEIFAAKNADWTIACTESDADEFKKLGAKSVIIAPNGISREAINRAEVSRLKNKFSRMGISKVILYIGSAHPPNLTGYTGLVGSRLGFLEDDTRLIFVGGVADMIYDYAQKLPNYAKGLYFDHTIFIGAVEEDTLSALLHIANQIILPILEGGGSNLKTAEAILADKQVVATTKAMHSYEKYANLPNLVVADDSDNFIGAMNSFLHTTKKERTATEQRLADEVTWQHTLKDMVKRLES